MIEVGRSVAPGVPRVLLTRDFDGNRSWARRLRREGLEPVSFPCLSHAVTRDADVRERFRAAVASAGEGDWLVFTSRRGVDSALEILAHSSAAAAKPPADLGLAAVGPLTAARCRQAFGRCDLEPPADEARGEALGRQLAEKPPGRALLCVARGGRRDVEKALRPAGWTVERFALYETRPVVPEPGEAGSIEIDAVFLASPSAVSALLARAEVHPSVLILAIGPTTAAALEEAGRTPDGVAASPGLEPLIALFRQFLRESKIPAEIRS